MKTRDDHYSSIIQYAIVWWQSMRPRGWDDLMHLTEPVVGCIGSDEINLALAVSEYYREYIHKVAGSHIRGSGV